jgi:thiol:disulfide interchange protein DsbC
MNYWNFMKNLRSLFALSLFFTVQACAQSTAPTPLKATPSKPASAQDNPAIRTALLKISPDLRINSIGTSVLPGFKEVVIDGKVVYASSDGKYLLQGVLIDLASRKNLTDISEAVIRKDVLAAVPDSRKIIFSPAKPKYTVTVFTDIDCGFCRKMHMQMAEYNKLGISVEYLFFPRAGVGSESFQKAVNVWCAPDRKTALTLAKSDKPLPKKNCTNDVANDFKLGTKVGVDGTPAVYAANGQTLGGYLSPKDLLKALQGLNK